MTSNGLKTEKKKKTKPQSQKEQDCMRNTLALIQRAGIGPSGMRRVLTYLQLAVEADIELQPAPVDHPNQLKVPGTQDEELPFE